MASEKPDDIKIVELTTAGSEIEALMWQDMLQEAGIRVMVKPGGPGAGAWASAATFEHTLFVRADDLEAARTVLGDALEQPYQGARSRRRAPRANRSLGHKRGRTH